MVVCVCVCAHSMPGMTLTNASMRNLLSHYLRMKAVTARSIHEAKRDEAHEKKNGTNILMFYALHQGSFLSHT